ncbi:MAG: hypothetical protein KAI66_23715 [Lentisphaeria bacterium]|nr:hypothetical protein [Lentisphaeria bacterium]
MSRDSYDLEALLDAYLAPPSDANLNYEDVRIIWVEENPALGARHIDEKHGVSKHEVEEVIFEVPPVVEARRSVTHPERTLFWGTTRNDRQLFIVCEDWTESGIRCLKPLTAFEPDEGEDY